VGRQRYSWNRTAFPFDSTSIVPVHDHVTEKTPNTQNTRATPTGQERNRSLTVRFVACIHTRLALRIHDTRAEHAHGDRCGSHTPPHRGLRSRESLQHRSTWPKI
jgi:hypothetical protein